MALTQMDKAAALVVIDLHSGVEATARSAYDHGYNVVSQPQARKETTDVKTKA